MTFSIKQIKGDIWRITLDDDRAFNIHLPVLDRFGIWTKTEIDEDEFTSLLKNETEYTLMQKSLFLLDLRQYSYKELFEKLYKYEKSKEIRLGVCDRLLSEGLLNDEKYAENLAYFYMVKKALSIRASLEKMVYLKGINKNTAYSVLEEYANLERENLEKTLEKKYSRKLSDKDDFLQIRKVKASLFRLGFLSEDIDDAINEYFEKEELN